MSALDFSVLSDDQLLELLRGACSEASRRGTAVESAAYDVALSAAEKARIAREAAEREAQRLAAAEAARIAEEAAEAVRRKASVQQEAEALDDQTRMWRKKRGIAIAVRELFADVEMGSRKNKSAVSELKVWRKNGDVRVFVGCGFDANAATLYVTGNDYHPPQTLELHSAAEKHRDRILSLLLQVAHDWTELTIRGMRRTAGYAGAPIFPAGFVPTHGTCRIDGCTEHGVTWDGDGDDVCARHATRAPATAAVSP